MLAFVLGFVAAALLDHVIDLNLMSPIGLIILAFGLLVTAFAEGLRRLRKDA